MDAAVITQPTVNFDALLIVAVDAFGFSPAAASDQSGRQMTEAERFVSCLKCFRDQFAAPGWDLEFDNHVSFSVLLGGSEDELRRVAEAAAGVGVFFVSRVALTGNSLGVVSGVLGDLRRLSVLVPEIATAFRSVGIEL